MYRVWIGNRESEILTYNIFEESITYFGSGNGTNSSFASRERIPSKYSDEFKAFVSTKIKKILASHSDAKFHFYNPMFAHRILKDNVEWKPYFANINDYETLKWMTSKTFVREWLSQHADVPPYALLSKDECKLTNLKSIFENFKEFIIQKDISSGGDGTYLLNENSEIDILSEINNNSLFLVSPYLFPKLSVCCHMMIDSEKPIIFPFGIQISENYQGRLLYKGSSYCEDFFDDQTKQRLKNIADIVGNRLLKVGYRGICGLDFLINENNIYFIEVNARYLGSSFLINKALKEQNLPSLFELNTLCFSSKLSAKIFNKFKLNYSSNTEKSKIVLHENDVYALVNDAKNKKSELFFDGLEKSCSVKKGTYLYREIIETK